MTELHTADGTVVASYDSGESLEATDSPRPYLHPMTTRAGVVVTDFAPADHRHHFGLSLAIPDVNKFTFWGGRTFVRDVGSTMLDNHGRQHRDSLAIDGGQVSESLTWLDRSGVAIATEARTVTIGEHTDPGAWTLTWSSTITPTADELRIASPAVNGRPGAGYGGLFWRFADSPEATVFSAEGAGSEVVHGSRARWLAVAARQADGQASTVVLIQGGVPLPWFFRDEEYVGGGPALAWDEPLIVPADGQLRCELRAVVFDGWLDDPAAIQALCANEKL